MNLEAAAEGEGAAAVEGEGAGAPDPEDLFTPPAGSQHLSHEIGLSPIDTIIKITGSDPDDREEIQGDLNSMADVIRTTLEGGTPVADISEDIAGLFARQQFGQSIVAMHVMHQLHENIVNCQPTKLEDAKFRLLIAKSMLDESGIGDFSLGNLSPDMMVDLIQRAIPAKHMKKTLRCIGKGTDQLNALFAKNALEEINMGIVPTMFRYIDQTVHFSQLNAAPAGEGGSQLVATSGVRAGVNYHALFKLPRTITIRTGIGFVDAFMARPQLIPPGVATKYNTIVDMCMANSINYMCNGCDITRVPASTSSTMKIMTDMIDGHDHDLERVMLVKLLKENFVHPRLFEIISGAPSIMSLAGWESGGGARAVKRIGDGGEVGGV
jgi:hypothetical protein